MQKKVTSNNNNNYNYIHLHTNNNKVNIDCAEAQSINNLDLPLEESLRSSFESFEGDSESGSEGGTKATRQISPLPKFWDWIKVDLYDNSKNHRPKHKLNITISVGGKIDSFKSLNNSPWSLYRRGIVDCNRDPHYQRVKQIRQELKQSIDQARIKVSKCYRSKYKKQIADTIHGFSTILIDEAQDNTYSVIFVYNQQEILIPLSGTAGKLTQRQRSAGQIATGMIRAVTERKGITADDFIKNMGGIL
jgi:hypothetical protein